MPPFEVSNPKCGIRYMEPGERSILVTATDPVEVFMFQNNRQDTGGYVISGNQVPSPDEHKRLKLKLEAIIRNGETFKIDTITGELVVKHVVKRPENNVDNQDANT